MVWEPSPVQLVCIHWVWGAQVSTQQKQYLHLNPRALTLFPDPNPRPLSEGRCVVDVVSVPLHIAARYALPCTHLTILAYESATPPVQIQRAPRGRCVAAAATSLNTAALLRSFQHSLHCRCSSCHNSRLPVRLQQAPRESCSATANAACLYVPAPLCTPCPATTALYQSRPK